MDGEQNVFLARVQKSRFATNLLLPIKQYELELHNLSLSLKFLKNLYTGECVPYSGQACINAGEKLGLTSGKFGWNYAEYNDQHIDTDIKLNGIKGCYAYSGGPYKDSYWYGNGDSAEIRGSLDHTDEFYRPEGLDCQIGYILSYEFQILQHIYLMNLLLRTL